MVDIKVKKKDRNSIKTLDKSKITAQKLKENIIKAKEIANTSYNNLRIDEENNNSTEYASNKVNNTIGIARNKGISSFNKYGRKSYLEVKDKIKSAKQKDFILKKQKDIILKEKGQIKRKQRNYKMIKPSEKANKKAIKSSINTGGKAIKTTENTAIAVQKNAKLQAKTAQKTAKIIKESARRTAQVTKATIKAVIRAVRAIILATKTLIAFLLAGGWIVVLIVTFICMIGLMVNSIFGIFFSNEDIGGNTKSMASVISELNQEFMGKITQIQNDNPYEEYDIEGSRANWKDVLAVYVAKYSNGDYKTQMITLDEDRIEQLKQIFWDMNEISFTKDVEKEEKVIIHLTWTEYKTVEHVKLHIKINSKNANEMADKYFFTNSQRNEIAELLKDEYLAMWSQVLYGTSGNSDIVEVARSQLGNVGGQPFWSWYGFTSRVEWCACFVSWCANECGYIEKGIIPKFSGCEAEGVAWFQACGLWQEAGYVPKSGDIIFFDWADKHDGKADHVGIVDKVENGRVYTIEGNSHDECKQRDYDINSSEIRGYGVPVY